MDDLNSKAGAAGLRHLRGTTAPRINWRSMGATAHFAQFYEADEILIDALAGFIGAGLAAGDACIVAATPEHREALESRLQAGGFDIVLAGTSNQFLALDAATLLANVSVDGIPEQGKFEKTVGRLIERAHAGDRRVRIFGEMVALLWADGKQNEAVRLEEFWNDLGEKYEFSLFCAYSTRLTDGEEHAERFAAVCRSHSHVIPSESYTDIKDDAERLRAIALLQQKAASLEAEIAERKRLLVLEKMARTEAETANRIKDEFLATVSHELRTPLNAIIGWSNMLSKGTLDEGTAKRAIETIKRQAQQQAQLIEDILDVTRVVSGKLRLNIGPVDAAAVINAAVDAVQPAADSKDIHLEVTLDPSARHISGDASRLQQVVWNLLSNAVKFTPEGGRVEVAMTRVASDLRIEVSDTGCGIRPENLVSIFDLFCQEDSSRTRKNGGLGLGLAIAKQLTELHGGTIAAVSSGEGRGSVFSVRLPIGKSPASLSQTGKASAFDILGPENEGYMRYTPLLKGVRVLLVDDDPDSLEMLKVALGTCRLKVETACSAEDACRILEWFAPDIIVSDIAMPGEDGLSLMTKLRAAGNTVPAIALTAHARVEDRVRALSSGFNMFVPKPVEIDELVAAISNLVSGDE